MAVVIVGVPPAQDREVFRSLEDARDGDPGLRGVMDRSGRGAAGEALQLEVAARVEDVERFDRHCGAAEGKNLEASGDLSSSRASSNAPNEAAYSFGIGHAEV